ncbi:histidine phosphatase family protein [Micromonospora sp. NPDC050686]|uniref:histidine phosphatase family protein n=1 Tax=Micromonospora sp. NPDC050686 TaxID=3154631 RepID=UPI0034009C04
MPVAAGRCCGRLLKISRSAGAARAGLLLLVRPLRRPSRRTGSGLRPRPDGGLSQLGREQADQLGRRLRTVPFSAIHHSPLARAVQTADLVPRHLPQVPRHDRDFVADRTPVPSAAERGRYPGRWYAWLDGVPDDERDEDAVALRAAARRAPA